MLKFVVERETPGIGRIRNQDFREIARRSNAAVAEIGARARWLYTYVSGDRAFCTFIGESEEAVRHHAELGGFHVHSVHEVKRIIDPATASAVTRIRG